ncbi:anthranilate synthase component I [Halobacteriales archaeon QS_3_64_16]|nr:MAG: anthranilate synthase component I [Halobacteriales archaeon QS_3_64_16]
MEPGVTSTGTPEIHTTEAAFRAVADRALRGARIPIEVRVTVADPFLAYRRAREDGGIYLATTGGQSGWGYFATDPVSRLQVGPESVPVVGDEDSPSPSLAELQNVLDGERLVRGECEVPYPCGAFGWLSYDLVRELEDLPDETIDDRELPILQIGVFDRVAAWEEPRPAGETTLYVTACPRLDGDPTAVYERGRERALALARAAVAGDPGVGPPPVRAGRANFESDCTEEEFAERVRRVKERIRAGDTFQANVSQRLRAPAAVHPVEAFDALRDVNPAPYSALLEFSGIDLVSASPELLLDVDDTTRYTAENTGTPPANAAPRLLTEPIAGTRPRGQTPAEDRALEADLLDDGKERAEHAMLVDLERNDLGKVSAYGSVEVSEYRRVDRYSAVMHLVSLVEGKLRPEYTLADAIAAVFPGGTITGAPKPKTMEIIEELEATRRGPYTGSIGVFGFDGRATLSMLIRTLVGREEEYSLRVGAGIVHDSVPGEEYRETLDKGRALIDALDAALDERDLGIEEAESEVAE